MDSNGGGVSGTPSRPESSLMAAARAASDKVRYEFVESSGSPRDAVVRVWLSEYSAIIPAKEFTDLMFAIVEAESGR